MALKNDEKTSEKNVDNPGKTQSTIIQDPRIPIRSHPPRSTVTKYPNPDTVRKKKEQDQVAAYLADMQKNKRPGGSFAL